MIHMPTTTLSSQPNGTLFIFLKQFPSNSNAKNQMHARDPTSDSSYLVRYITPSTSTCEVDLKCTFAISSQEHVQNFLLSYL